MVARKSPEILDVCEKSRHGSIGEYPDGLLASRQRSGQSSGFCIKRDDPYGIDGARHLEKGTSMVDRISGKLEREGVI